MDILTHHSSVNPIYFVCFTTATITASTILFKGFNVDSPVYVISLIAGFIVIFTGVYLLDSIARGGGAGAHSNTNNTQNGHPRSEDEEYLLDDEDALGLTELNDDSDDEDRPRRTSAQRFR